MGREGGATRAAEPGGSAEYAAATAARTASRERTRELDPVLASLGFEIGVVSEGLVTGRLLVTEACVQPFKVLHGGVSALVSEALASMGAHVASGYRRVAGLQLSINHLRSAQLGELVEVEARPVHAGRTIQVWEVKLHKVDPATSEKQAVVSTSRVTLLTNLPVPERAADADKVLRKYARAKL